MTSGDDDKVGYRKPPSAHRFAKGQSGNPTGRPKKAKDFATVLRTELRRRVKIAEGGKQVTLTRLEALVRSMTLAALKGDAKASKTIVDWLERLPPEPVRQNRTSHLSPEHERLIREAIDLLGTDDDLLGTDDPAADEDPM
jgi:hypothetical protein